jgi:hypothetical protein
LLAPVHSVAAKMYGNDVRVMFKIGRYVQCVQQPYIEMDVAVPWAANSNWALELPCLPSIAWKMYMEAMRRVMLMNWCVCTVYS